MFDRNKRQNFYVSKPQFGQRAPVSLHVNVISTLNTSPIFRKKATKMEKNQNCENQIELKPEKDPEEESSDDDDESLADTISDGSETDVSESRPSCPICLRNFSCQQIGYPEDCSSTQHVFCALCIEEWAKNVTTCPIDRKEFTKICILDNWIEKKVIRSVPVTRKEYNEAELEAVDDLTYCEVCHLANNEHSMLLCDGT